MTKVSYYILGETDPEARRAFAVKFVRQSFRNGLEVHLHVPSRDDAVALDHALWEDDESFIPHDITTAEVPIQSPVTIGWEDPVGRHGILVNLGGTLPEWFSHFAHLVEVVIQEPSVLADTRANWQHLKFQGYPMTQHDLRS
jgi:DNA polymerase III subunit chi